MPTVHSLPRFTDLTLILTEHCNLHCSFCYVPKERARMMPREVALRAVDLLVDRAPPGAPLSLSFFGGEPFMAGELMADVLAHARRRRPEGLTFGTPTNGTLVDGPAAELIHDYDLSIALSIDTIGGNGGHTLERLRSRGVLERLRGGSPLVRMTVTPDNVAELFETTATLFEQGLSRVMHQPALEVVWPQAAVTLWREQHERLADWACQRYQDRLPLPDLTVLEGIVRRLEGQAVSYCGAGVRIGAVAPDGKIYGCYRSVYDPLAEKLALGDLFGGAPNEPLIQAYAQLHPHRARPEEGECRRCAAQKGCTIFCPATGHVLCGDLRGVSAIACSLLREQVAVCEEMLRRMRRIDRVRRRRVGTHVAAAALALSLSGGAVGCGDDNGPNPDGPVGGVCPVQIDSGVDGPNSFDGPVGGVCPVPPPDGQIVPDGPVGGVCPVPAPDGMVGGVCPAPTPDGMVPVPAPDGMVGGVCPAPTPDGMVPGPAPDGMVGGVCPVPAPDGMVGGVCPVPAPDGFIPPGPGLCPAPIKDGS